MLEEQRERPYLLISQDAFPRWHACPADAVFNFPKRVALRDRPRHRPSLVAEVTRFPLCDGRNRSFAFRRAVADRTMLLIKVDASDQIGIRQGDRIRAVGCVTSRVASNDVPAAQISNSPAFTGIGGDEASAQNSMAAGRGNNDRHQYAECEPSQRRISRSARSSSGIREEAVGKFCSIISARVSQATSSASSAAAPSPDCQRQMTATRV